MYGSWKQGRRPVIEDFIPDEGPFIPDEHCLFLANMVVPARRGHQHGHWIRKACGRVYVYSALHSTTRCLVE